MKWMVKLKHFFDAMHLNIWNAQKWQSIVIFISDQLYCTVHHPTKFQADTCNRHDSPIS